MKSPSLPAWRWWAAAGGLLLLGSQVVIYNHAWALTHFVEGGERTAKPEALSSAEKARLLVTGVRIPRPQNLDDPSTLGLRFETHRVASVGETLELWTLPHPAPVGEVLLFHGYGGCKSTLLPAMQAWHARGWSVVATDFRGSGGSTGSETSLGLREADDVRSVVDWARERTPSSRRVAFGFSMGGAALIHASALQELPVDGIIVEAVFDDLPTTVGHRFEAMGLPPFPAAQLLLAWGSLQLGANAFSLAPALDAEKVSTPVLVLAGAHDARVHPQEAKRVADALPNGTFHVFPELGHQPSIVADPDQWWSVAAPFLEGL